MDGELNYSVVRYSSHYRFYFFTLYTDETRSLEGVGMCKRKLIFGVILIALFLAKQWWLLMPLLGFVLGYVARVEVERQRKGKRV